MNKEIIHFLNILEGYKTRCKSLHWAADNINTHEYLDKFLDEISEFQDAIAEGYLGIKGEFNYNDFTKICQHCPVRRIKRIRP